MLPALRALKRLKCIVKSFHADGSGALPVLSELAALEELHMEGQLAGDYKLAFPPSLKVPNHAAEPCMQRCNALLQKRGIRTQVHAADTRGCST